LPRLDSSNKLRVGSGKKGVSPPLVLSWPGLEEVLPDGGLPRGVVELAAPRALGGSTSIALAAVRAGQERSGGAWCAWIDPERTLYAPGVIAAGVDLTRMLVVCPPRVDLGRVSVKLVCAGAFEVVVVDFDAISGVRGRNTGVGAGKRRALSPEVLVRKLALAAEPSGTTVLLLTDATRARAVPWPVTLRLELTRPSRRDLSVYIAKDRFGRVGFAKTIPFRPLMHAAG
jgi:recombination protein RecA